ncbi:hypothetical protein AJ79_08567 [Helicocarpus griseus UAMH5409]|uniref:Uncharacterized protein n=1 Tax=Helicocarpus griseus UAMH5409 TaxID=1447875 RepID=A0A2B7WS29_9EURO|nr:hypothetical protein AJ79_08567 [Helicocarpus griseus UAMH5409]
MPDLPSTLYYASSFLCAVTIPKHILVEFKHVYKTIAQIPSSPEYACGKPVAPTGWNFGVGILAFSSRLLALMNLKWATRGGPSSWEEIGVIYTYLGTGAVMGCRYFRINMYSPLGILWAAPLMSTIAIHLQ